MVLLENTCTNINNINMNNTTNKMMRVYVPHTPLIVNDSNFAVTSVGSNCRMTDKKFELLGLSNMTSTDW